MKRDQHKMPWPKPNTDCGRVLAIASDRKAHIAFDFPNDYTARNRIGDLDEAGYVWHRGWRKPPAHVVRRYREAGRTPPSALRTYRLIRKPRGAPRLTQQFIHRALHGGT